MTEMIKTKEMMTLMSFDQILVDESAVYSDHQDQVTVVVPPLLFLSLYRHLFSDFSALIPVTMLQSSIEGNFFVEKDLIGWPQISRRWKERQRKRVKEFLIWMRHLV